MNKKLTAAKQNKFTTIIGLIMVVLSAVKLLTDGDPLTNPDWNELIPTFTLGLGGLGLIGARDGDVTSEQSGAS